MLGFPHVCMPVCCALSCVPCDLPHLVFVCVSRPVVQGGGKASRCCCTPGVPLHSERAPRQNAGMTRESFLAELQDRQTKERRAAPGLQWWLLLHRLLLRPVERSGPACSVRPCAIRVVEIPAPLLWWTVLVWRVSGHVHHLSCPCRAAMAQGWVHTVKIQAGPQAQVFPAGLREGMGRGLPLLSRFDAYRQRGHGGDSLSFFVLTLLGLN